MNLNTRWQQVTSVLMAEMISLRTDYNICVAPFRVEVDYRLVHEVLKYSVIQKDGLNFVSLYFKIRNW